MINRGRNSRGWQVHEPNGLVENREGELFWIPPGNRSHRIKGLMAEEKGVNTAAPRKEAVSVELPCSIRAFSEAAGVSVGKVLGTLMSMGLPGGFNINSELDLESAELIAAELDLTIQLPRRRISRRIGHFRIRRIRR